MPTFHAGEINIRLSVADLEQTITTAPVNSLSSTSTDNADRATRQFENDAPDGILAETTLLSDENGCRLGFLGDQQDIAFIMVHAQPKYPHGAATIGASTAKEKPPPLQLATHSGSGDVVDSSLSELSSPPWSPAPPLDASASRTKRSLGKGQTHSLQRVSSVRQLDGGEDEGTYVLGTEHRSPMPGSSAGPLIAPAPIDNQSASLRQSEFSLSKQEAAPSGAPGPQHPQALCLRVIPSKNTFLRNFNEKKGKWNKNDIKMDVYLNGDLCASTYVSERVFNTNSDAGNAGNARIFSGARTHRLKEVPWILKPPANANVSSMGQHEAARTAEIARNRWKDISDRLTLAADANGRNKKGELPVVGRYLQSLAAVPMPATLLDVLRTSRNQFAVIDVVVIAGKGSKDDVSGDYQFGVLPLELPGYGLHTHSGPPKDDPEARGEQQKDGSSRIKRSFADEEIAAQSFSLHHVPRNSTGGLTLKIGSRKEDDTDLSKDPSDNQALRMTESTHESEAGPAHAPSTSGARQPHVPRGLLSLPPRGILSARKTPVSFQTPQSNEVSNTLPSNITHRTDERPVPAPAAVPRPSSMSATPTARYHHPGKRKRVYYYDVLDTRQTTAEEMEDIAKQAADKDAIFFTERRVTRSKLVDRPDIDASDATQLQLASNSLASAPAPSAPETNSQNALARRPPTSIPDPKTQTVESPTPRLQLQYRRPAPPMPIDGAESSSPEKPLLLHHRTALLRPQTALEPSTPQAQVDTTSVTRLKLSSPKEKKTSRERKRPKKTKKPAQRNKLTPWEKPSSKDSIVTYAEHGMHRQIRAERVGCFVEENVLIGVRFVVG
ncbi:MAG: hypothetical protein LQ345_002374 [Seirophora villosa]|nr:MAG: hypothetical protein LQ345_002374 [Seirophora villosa]